MDKVMQTIPITKYTIAPNKPKVTYFASWEIYLNLFFNHSKNRKMNRLLLKKLDSLLIIMMSNLMYLITTLRKFGWIIINLCLRDISTMKVSINSSRKSQTL